ncbi:MAG: hypothetical protein ACBR50_10290 [Microcoleus sp.]|uniref:hypothetical protein n=1 Tax=Microcoleus sp. CAWBG640 TaxID=2841653 RepID=UPI00312B7698
MISDDRTIIANSCRVRRHQISSNAIEHLTATHLQNVPPSDIFKIGKSAEELMLADNLSNLDELLEAIREKI